MNIIGDKLGEDVFKKLLEKTKFQKKKKVKIAGETGSPQTQTETENPYGTPSRNINDEPEQE
jgi:hypothetical protein